MNKELTTKQKKDCLKGEVWTQPELKEYEGSGVWSYPIMWGNRWIFDVPASNKNGAIKLGIDIIAHEEW